MTWVLRDSCPGPQVTSGSVCLPCPRPSRARGPLQLPEPPGPGAHRRVPAMPARAGRMDSLRAALQRLRPAGGVRRVDRAGAGPAGSSPSAGAAAGRGAFRPRAAPCLGPCGTAGRPRRGGGRRGGQCQAGGLAFRCPLLGAARPPARPPAQPRGGPANSCCEPTAAPAGAPARTCPGEVRPCLPHRASGLGEDCFRGRRSGPEQAPGEVESGSDPGTERLGKVEPGAAPGPRMFAPG